MRKKTHQKFLEQARKVHGDRYEYLEEYINNITPMSILCKEHKPFKQKPNKHLAGQNCPDCARIERANKNRKSNEIFLMEANKIHKGKYSYPEKYKSAKEDMNIICPEHGTFSQTPDAHITQKAGCPDCRGSKISASKTYSLEKFIKLAKKKHGDRYLYTMSIYEGGYIDIDIICNEHGVFTQNPSVHLRGAGCPICGAKLTASKNLKPTHILIEQFIAIHGNKYDYCETENLGSKHKVKILCKKHNKPFWQNPNSHLRGHGCPICSKSKTVSKSEIIWLNNLGVPNDKDHRQVYMKLPGMTGRKYMRADGFDPETKTIYEYLGDFYHGNPKIFKPDDYNDKLKKTYGELYQEWLKKEKLIKDAGYKLITIWGSDFIALSQKKI